jgi:DNA-binding GntR family transcriptional regulator
MTTIFEKQKRETLVDMALRDIRTAIRTGKLKPGDRIVETRLAEKMNISRFPIREALRYLEKEGLVRTSSFKGTYVSEFDKQARKSIESYGHSIGIVLIDCENPLYSR